jgi:predicted amidohydrolase YtcJ
MLLLNARISGVGGSEPVSVRLSNGAIVSIDTANGAEPPSGQETARETVVDLAGRWLVPGLWDNHVHFDQWSLHSRRLDVSHAESAAETASLVAIAIGAADFAPGDVLTGVGFRDGLWPDEPLAAVLDSVSGNQPVALVSGDLHSVWLNSRALELFGFADHPTGLLREGDAFIAQGFMNTVSDDVLDRYVQVAATAAAARGVVGIVDLEMAYNYDSWSRRSAAGFDSLRVEFGVYPQHLERAISEGLRGGDSITELVRVGPFKVITDGSLNTRTAFCYDPYPGAWSENDRGLLTVAPEELRGLMATAVAAKFRPAVHAIGDRANTVALDAFEAVGCHGTIEHAQLLNPADVARFAKLGVVASVQPEHALDDRDVADLYWAGRTGAAFVLRTLLDSGATLAFGSDAPVAPLDPWVTMAAAVGRTRDGRAPWHPEQRISAAEALAASVRSRVAVGEPADLVVTEMNPVDADADSLRTMTVAATLLGGRFTYNAL